MSDKPPANPTLTATPFPDRYTTLTILTVLTLPSFLGLAAALYCALASPMALEAGSWGVFALWCTSPIVFIIGIVGSWDSFHLKHYRLALVLALLPALEICMYLISSLLLLT